MRAWVRQRAGETGRWLLRFSLGPDPRIAEPNDRPREGAERTPKPLWGSFSPTLDEALANPLAGPSPTYAHGSRRPQHPTRDDEKNLVDTVDTVAPRPRRSRAEEASGLAPLPGQVGSCRSREQVLAHLAERSLYHVPTLAGFTPTEIAAGVAAVQSDDRAIAWRYGYHAGLSRAAAELARLERVSAIPADAIRTLQGWLADSR